MPLAAIEAYLNKLEARKTEAKLLLADVVSLPHMKEKDRRTTMNGWMKLLSIHVETKTKPASPGRLRLMGIGVKHVK